MSKETLHRIREVRLCQGLSLRQAARGLELSVSETRDQELATSDLLLSELYRWQHVLKAPVAELLVESGPELSPLVSERANMVKLMKTALTIAEKATTAPVRRLAQNLVNQLLEMMPTLATVASWHEVGQRRTRDEYGRIVERTLSDELLRSHLG